MSQKKEGRRKKECLDYLHCFFFDLYLDQSLLVMSKKVCFFLSLFCDLWGWGVVLFSDFYVLYSFEIG